jgi:parallel beta-helix repeat protein
MKTRRFVVPVLSAMLLMGSAASVHANNVTAATGTVTCSSYFLEFTGTDLTPPATYSVHYSVTLTPTSGTPVIITGIVPIPAETSGSFDVTVSKSFGPLARPHTITASSATLFSNAGAQNTIPIVFTSAIASCGSSEGPQKTVACGDTLSDPSVEYILAANLVCKISPAVTITADNVRFNLKGHSLSGTGGIGISIPGTPPQSPSTPNLNIHVHNGKLQGFGTGMDVFTGSAAIDQMTIVAGNAANSVSINLHGGGQNVLSNNELDGGGIVVFSSGGNTMTENVLKNASIELQLGGGNNLLIGNTLTGGSSGIAIEGNTRGNIIQSNVIWKGSGIVAGGPGATQNFIRDNTVINNVGFGIAMNQRGLGNTITENIALGNGLADLFQYELDPPICGNTWFGNTFKTVATFPPNDPPGCIPTIK